MLSRRRISAALIALLLVVLGAWLVREVLGVGEADPRPGSLPGAVSHTPTVPVSVTVPGAHPGWRPGCVTGEPRWASRPVLGTREMLLPHSPSGFCARDDRYDPFVAADT